MKEFSDSTTTARSGETLRQALSVRDRPGSPNALTASLTFGWRALLRIKYVPEQLLDVTLFPVMFLLMFTFLFGGAIAGSTVEYLQFLLPGIVVMNISMITIYTGIDLNKDVTKGIFDRFRLLPVWRPSVLVGALLVDIVRYTVAALVMIFLGLLLGFRPGGGFFGVTMAVLLLLVFSFSLSWIWTALGLVMRSERSLMNVSMNILFPLTFISNVFVDPDTLPRYLRAFVNVNPISLVTTAVRGLMHGMASLEQIAWALVSSFILVLIFAPLTMHLYRNKQ